MIRAVSLLLAGLALALALLAPLGARAQDTATLLADRVRIETESVLIAEGNVEVLWRGTRLRASRIVYDRAADRLQIDGPITLTQGTNVALFAEQAELTADLQDGLMQSARLVLNQQLQLAAVEIARVGGRYTELDKVVASSCQVCPSNPVPLWSIRARRVIHDQQERQIYFEGAQFRVAGVPIAHIPRLRFPDPTLQRANGFLFPTIRSSSARGTGLKLPYFITLGRSADLTVTPYLSSKTTTLELRYRQAFRTGDVEFLGAVSRDDILPGETRYYVFGDGAFDLPRDFKLTFGLQFVSDDAYLVDYGYGDDDRLESSLALTRTRRDEQTEARLVGFRSLRDGDDNSTLPSIMLETSYQRRFFPVAIGGVATVELERLATYRTSEMDGDGRDVNRTSASLNWRRGGVFGPGIQAVAEVGLNADYVTTADDTSFDASIARAQPELGLTLRWPLSKVTSGGVTHMLEPMAMLAWSGEDLDATPNEDSVLVELDEANLLAFSRFPGADMREEGLRLALGLGWTRIDPDGWQSALTFGRILRETPPAYFGAGTGLDGIRSDWLMAANLQMPNRVAMTARALLDDDFGLTKGDIRLGYTDARFDIETGLVFLTASAAENRPDDISEWALDGAWRINTNWTGRFDWRYDIEESRAARAGLGLGWKNECLSVDLSLSRRFTSSTSLSPTTDFGLSVELIGFGTGSESGAPRRRCIN
jgi:LPS-assembly protein